MSSYLVNFIPGIKSKRYLELGIYHGHNFSSVNSESKVSVDSKFPALFQCTTDEFFTKISSSEKFDVIYIDACHQWESVVRDFNNSVKHLNPGGFIFVHDLIPGTEKLTASHFCGDGFKVLAHILKNQPKDFEMSSLNSDYGLTMFNNPKVPILMSPESQEISYSEFREILASYRLYSRKELQDIIGGYCDSKKGPKPKTKAKPKTPKSKETKSTVSSKDSSNRRSRVHRASSSKKSSRR